MPGRTTAAPCAAVGSQPVTTCDLESRTRRSWPHPRLARGPARALAQKASAVRQSSSPTQLAATLRWPTTPCCVVLEPRLDTRNRAQSLLVDAETPRPALSPSTVCHATRMRAGPRYPPSPWLRAHGLPPPTLVRRPSWSWTPKYHGSCGSCRPMYYMKTQINRK